MSSTKNRHGCFIAYLIFTMIANSGSALLYVLSGNAIKEMNAGMPDWTIPVLTVFCILNLVFCIALFQFKKWAFFGSCASAGLVAVVNFISGLSIGSVVMGIVGIAILFGVLHIGGEKKAWTQLE